MVYSGTHAMSTRRLEGKGRLAQCLGKLTTILKVATNNPLTGQCVFGEPRVISLIYSFNKLLLGMYLGPGLS